MIIFESRLLPTYACALDQLSREWAHMSEENADWFWRFPICVGKNKTSESKDVIRHCTVGFEVTDKYEVEALQEFVRIFPDHDARAILSSLRDSLTTMAEIAQTRSECTWTSPLLPTDRTYFENESTTARRVLKALDEWRDESEEQ